MRKASTWENEIKKACLALPALFFGLLGVIGLYCVILSLKGLALLGYK